MKKSKFNPFNLRRVHRKREEAKQPSSILARQEGIDSLRDTLFGGGQTAGKTGLGRRRSHKQWSQDRKRAMRGRKANIKRMLANKK